MFGLFPAAYAAWPVWILISFAVIFAIFFIFPRWSPAAVAF